MAYNRYPHLCGGTFFNLLLQARKQRSKARDTISGKNDGLSDQIILFELICVAQKIEHVPPKTTFTQNTSEYKKCVLSSGTYLPFEDDAYAECFDNKVKTEFAKAMNDMNGFIQRYIAVSDETKVRRLVAALLELIETDDDIVPEREFYSQSNGKPITKAELKNITEINLTAFLVGIWHFIIMNRKDNTIGSDTYIAWHEKPDVKNAKWKFTSTIGCGITRTINITTDISTDDTVFEAVEIIDHDDHETSNSEQDEPYADQPDSEPTTVNQTINAPAVFFNSGANVMQINNTGTINIDRSGKS